MKIPKEILTKREHGDIVAIVRQSKISRPTVTEALMTGQGSRKTVTAIIKYFNKIENEKRNLEQWLRSDD